MQCTDISPRDLIRPSVPIVKRILCRSPSQDEDPGITQTCVSYVGVRLQQERFPYAKNPVLQKINSITTIECDLSVLLGAYNNQLLSAYRLMIYTFL